MHDIDTAQAEYEAEDYESEFYEGESEYEDAFESEADELPLSEEQEMELAADLLEVSSDEELDQFIGSLIGIGSKLLPGIAKGVGSLFGRRRRRRRGRAMPRGRGKALGGVLKGVAKTALPFVGGALGSIVPGVGTAIGGALGSALGGMFEMELEGLSGEDQEMEQARRFVQLATTAAQKAAAIPPHVDPRAAADHAVKAAARIVAPQAVKGGAGARRAGHSGRWMRRGNKIVVYGV